MLHGSLSEIALVGGGGRFDLAPRKFVAQKYANFSCKTIFGLFNNFVLFCKCISTEELVLQQTRLKR